VLQLGTVEGWVVTHDGETLKSGFKNDFEAVEWMHKRHSYSIDHAVRHEGYDIVLVKDGKVVYSYKQEAKKRHGLGAKVKAAKHPMPIWPEFVDAYLEAALWTNQLEKTYGIQDFAQTAVDQAVKDSNDFILSNRKDLDEASSDRSRHGHDFWLTRNRHGAGFWDRGYGVFGDMLTDAAHAYGEVSVYVGDDEKVYFG
jgi:hypothetical protein